MFILGCVYADDIQLSSRVHQILANVSISCCACVCAKKLVEVLSSA